MAGTYGNGNSIRDGSVCCFVRAVASCYRGLLHWLCFTAYNLLWPYSSCDPSIERILEMFNLQKKQITYFVYFIEILNKGLYFVCFISCQKKKKITFLELFSNQYSVLFLGCWS